MHHFKLSVQLAFCQTNLQYDWELLLGGLMVLCINKHIQIFSSATNACILIFEFVYFPEGHHTQTTNRGYSRKPDGGFFTS